MPAWPAALVRGDAEYSITMPCIRGKLAKPAKKTRTSGNRRGRSPSRRRPPGPPGSWPEGPRFVILGSLPDEVAALRNVMLPSTPLSKPLKPLKPLGRLHMALRRFNPRSRMSSWYLTPERSRGFSGADASRRCRRASRRSDAPTWEAASRRAFSLRTTVRRAGLQLGPGGLGNHGGGRDTPGLRSPRPWSPPTSGWPCLRPAQAPRSPDPVKPGSVKPGSVKPSTR